jgi:hypothetical protein
MGDFRPVAVGVNADPSPSSSPLQQEERRPGPLAGEAPALQHFGKRRGERRGVKAEVTIVEAASRPSRGEQSLVAAHQEDFLF